MAGAALRERQHRSRIPLHRTLSGTCGGTPDGSLRRQPGRMDYQLQQLSNPFHKWGRHQHLVDNQDGWIINSSNSATHFTNGVDTNTWSSGSWPSANKYYIFYRDNCTTIPNYDYSLYPSDTWNTHSSATDPLNANCHKKVYRVWVDPGFRYTFKTGCDNGATADFDTYLELFNSSGTRLAYNDDSCGSQSKIEYLSNSSEYLYLVVRGYNQYSTGSYTLAHKMEFNPSYYSITPTTSYQTHSFTTSSTTPSKIYRFYVSSDDVSNHTTFIFKTSCGNGASASFDTWMDIRNANGTWLTSNDDGACGNTGSYIAYQPTQSGYMFLIVSGYNNATGSYTLTTPGAPTRHRPPPVAAPTIRYTRLG